MSNEFEMAQPGEFHGLDGEFDLAFDGNAFSQHLSGNMQHAPNSILYTPESIITPPGEDVNGGFDADTTFQSAQKKGKKAAKSKAGTSKKGEGAKTGAGVQKAKAAPKKKAKVAIEVFLDEEIEESPEEIAIRIEKERKAALRKKEKKANTLINKQMKETALEKQMGTNVSVAYTPAGGVLMHGVFWKNPNPDATIPSTNAEIKARIQQLVLAMTNNQGCRETADTPQFQNRWAAGATHYSKEELEMTAFEILVSLD
jgi:hypothetical protein